VTVSGFVCICVSISPFCRFFSVFVRSLGFAPRLPSSFWFGQVCFWSFLLSRENEAHGLPYPQFRISALVWELWILQFDYWIDGCLCVCIFCVLFSINLRTLSIRAIGIGRQFIGDLCMHASFKSTTSSFFLCNFLLSDLWICFCVSRIRVFYCLLSIDLHGPVV